jgi:hypothetical protein
MHASWGCHRGPGVPAGWSTIYRGNAPAISPIRDGQPMRRPRPPSTMEEKRRRAWQNLITFARYHRLKVAPAWRTYEGFARDVSLPPAANHALRRLKPTEGFKPGNVVWAR